MLWFLNKIPPPPKKKIIKNWLRASKALSLFNDVLLRTRRALLLYKVYGDSAPSGCQWNIIKQLLKRPCPSQPSTYGLKSVETLKGAVEKKKADLIFDGSWGPFLKKNKDSSVSFIYVWPLATIDEDKDNVLLELTLICEHFHLFGNDLFIHPFWIRKFLYIGTYSF